ncbi:MAG: hypothetical protein LBB10_00915, partial [Bifidobacteriaceae bacterium]|nr:hypothetical protein [Bifidobacteriaceae bacterium]
MTFLFTYFLVLPTNSSFSAYDDGGPPIPGNIQNTVIQGTYINDSGNLQWEKLMPDPANSESTNPQYADVYRPGFKHICGATFLLMATQ